MAIERLPKDKLPPPLSERLWGVVDLEWYPSTYELRLVGLYIRGRYYAFYTLEDFFRFLLTPRFKGIQLYAHYGGKADFVFFIAPLIRAGYRLTGLVSGSSVISMTISDGRNTWELRDSFWLFLDKLDSVGKSFIGRGKSKCAFDAPINLLRSYNENDCVILAASLVKLDELWRSLGGALAITNASNAMTLFRAVYLNENGIKTNPDLNKLLREKAFVASRVEVFRRDFTQAIAESGNTIGHMYDIRSAHPSAYYEPLPGALRETNGFNRRLDNPPYFADVEVEVPAGLHIPPLPIRVEGRILFPTGRFRSIYNDVDLMLLEQCGGRVTKVHSVWHFEPCYDLAGYADALFPLKEKFKKEALGQLAKLALNGLYGKFAEDENRTGVIFGALTEGEARLATRKPVKGHDSDCDCNLCQPIKIVSSGVAIKHTIRHAAHEHLPFACAITSSSRYKLTTGLWALEKAGSFVMYSDTDCAPCTPPRGGEPIPVGPKIGQWDIQYDDITGGVFGQPKLYGLHFRDPKTCKPCDGTGKDDTDNCEWCAGSGVTYEHVKAKGLRRMHYHELESYLRGEYITTKRMMRVPELIKASKKGAAITPRDKEVRKRATGAVQPTRCFYDGNRSRPYDFDEWLTMTGVKKPKRQVKKR